jgi:putative CocE/NonD family hydrolase
VGDLDYGPEADVDFLPIELRWYDYWLKGIDNGMMEEPPVDIFVMGENRWRSEHEWPLSRARDSKYFLHSGGRANSRFGDGRLGTTSPGEEPPDSFVYNPEDPVPTYGGNVSMYPSTGGPRDQRAIQRRDDVLVYTSEKLESDVEVTGRILTELYAASTATDTDFTAKLNDVHPNGYAQLLAEGIIRARYRNSFKKQELLTPGEVYEYTVDLWSVSHVFKKGHKIQLEISSSNFPKYDRNPNTGHKYGEDAELEKATQTIYHSQQHPSSIILPVVP